MFNGKVQERLLYFTVRSTFVHRHLLPVDIWTVEVTRKDNVLSLFMFCNLFKRLIESFDVVEIPMRHVVGAEDNILLVSCLHFSPNYFTVCGQLRLGVSYEAFLSGREYTTTFSSTSVVPMDCLARETNFILTQGNENKKQLKKFIKSLYFTLFVWKFNSKSCLFNAAHAFHAHANFGSQYETPVKIFTSRNWFEQVFILYSPISLTLPVDLTC